MLSQNQDPALSDATKTAWVQRVLGVTVVPPATAAGAPDGRAVMRGVIADWADTLATAGEQLEGLRRVLLATADPAMHRIAEFGLNALTGKLRTTLDVALREVAAADAAARGPAAAKAKAAVAAFRGFIMTDKRVAVCDACPTVKVRLRDTYGAGLDQIEHGLGLVA